MSDPRLPAIGFRQPGDEPPVALPRLTLDECDDTLRDEELASVLGISVRTIQRQRLEGRWKIPTLRGLKRAKRTSKLAVQKYLEGR